jgi:hypothetical protein
MNASPAALDGATLVVAAILLTTMPGLLPLLMRKQDRFNALAWLSRSVEAAVSAGIASDPPGADMLPAAQTLPLAPQGRPRPISGGGRPRAPLAPASRAAAPGSPASPPAALRLTE